MEKNKYDFNGRRDGLWEEYFANGHLHYQGKYINGLYDGEWVKYDTDGSLLFKGHYKKGLIIGFWEWYDGGILEEIIYYIR
jgi:antitoxin component YwqK of YwqJK toxin-antitoxin module